MARENPETTVTNRIRHKLECRGAVFIKLSDSYTRGIPDAAVSINRLVFVEFKVDRLKGWPSRRSWRSLGLSGAQDHVIKAFSRRDGRSVCVVTDSLAGGKLALWVPEDPTLEISEDYLCRACGDGVYQWLD